MIIVLPILRSLRVRAQDILFVYRFYSGGVIVKPRWLAAEKIVKISVAGILLCHNRVV